jgi:hypothetical protein
MSAGIGNNDLSQPGRAAGSARVQNTDSNDEHEDGLQTLPSLSVMMRGHAKQYKSHVDHREQNDNFATQEDKQPDGIAQRLLYASPLKKQKVSHGLKFNESLFRQINNEELHRPLTFIKFTTESLIRAFTDAQIVYESVAYRDIYTEIFFKKYMVRLTAFTVQWIVGKDCVVCTPNFAPSSKYTEVFSVATVYGEFCTKSIIVFVAYVSSHPSDILTAQYELFPIAYDYKVDTKGLHYSSQKRYIDFINIYSGAGVYFLADFLLDRALNLAVLLQHRNEPPMPLCPIFWRQDEMMVPNFWTNKCYSKMNAIVDITTNRITPMDTTTVIDEPTHQAQMYETCSCTNYDEPCQDIPVIQAMTKLPRVKNPQRRNRVPRSELRKQQEENEVNRSLPVNIQNEIERPPEEWAYDKYSQRIQYGPWFLRIPVFTLKQEKRLKFLFPSLLYGEFDIKLFSKAFFHFNTFLFQQQYFRNLDEEEWRKRAIKAFHSVMDGRSLVRLQEDMKPSFTTKLNTVCIWLENYRLFSKVFCGTRESRIATVWEEARKSHKPKHQAQMFESIKEFFTLKPYVSGIASLLWDCTKSAMKDLPGIIAAAVTEAISLSLKSMSAAIKRLRELLTDALATIKEFLFELFPPGAALKFAKLGLVVLVMSILILLLICIPQNFDKMAMTLVGMALASMAVMLGFAVADDYLDIFDQGEQKHEAQSWDSVYKIIVFIGSLFSLRNISTIFSIGRNIKPVFSDLKEFLCKAWNWVYRGITGDNYWPEYDDVSNLKHFLERIQVLFDEPGFSTNYKVVKDYALRTVNLSKEANRYKIVLSKMKMENALIRTYNDIITNLCDKATEIEASSAFFRDRYEPVCVLLRGKPNQGKSLVSKILPEAVYAHCKAKFASEFPLEWSREMIFTPSMDDFCDGISVYSQCWAQDDFLQSRDRQIRAREAVRFIQLVSPARMAVASARLEGKGNTFVTTPFIMLTSNFDPNNGSSVAECNVEEPQAFRRRFHIICEVTKLQHFDDPIEHRNEAWNFRIYAPDSKSDMYIGQKAAFDVLPDWVQARLVSTSTGYDDFTFKEVCDMTSDMIVLRAQQFRHQISTNYDWTEPDLRKTRVCSKSTSDFDFWVRQAYCAFLQVKNGPKFLNDLRVATLYASSTSQEKTVRQYWHHLIVSMIQFSGIMLSAAETLFLQWWDEQLNTNQPLPKVLEDYNDPPRNPYYAKHCTEDFPYLCNPCVDEYYKNIDIHEAQGLKEFLDNYSKTAFKDTYFNWTGFKGTLAWLAGTPQHTRFNMEFSADFKKNWKIWTPLDYSQALINHHCLFDEDDPFRAIVSPDYEERKQFYKHIINHVVECLEGRLHVLDFSTAESHPFMAVALDCIRKGNAISAMKYMLEKCTPDHGTALDAEIPYWISRLAQRVFQMPGLITEWQAMLRSVPNWEQKWKDIQHQTDYAGLIPSACAHLLAAIDNLLTTEAIYYLSIAWSVAVAALVIFLSSYFWTKAVDKPFEAQSLHREKMARLADKQPLRLQYTNDQGIEVTTMITKDMIEKEDPLVHEAQAGLGDNISSQINKFSNSIRTLRFIREDSSGLWQTEGHCVISGRRAILFKHIFKAKGTTFDTIQILNGSTVVQSFDAKLCRIVTSTAEGRDVAYVDFPRDFPEMPSLKDQFLDVKTLANMDEYVFYRLTREIVSGTPQILVYQTGLLKPGDTSTADLQTREGIEIRYTITDFWIAVNGQGVPGDCGKILIAASLRTGHVKIIGLHVGRSGNDTYFSRLSNDDLLVEPAFTFQCGPDKRLEIPRSGVHIPSYVQPTLQYKQKYDGRLISMGTVKTAFIPTETNFIASPFQGNDQKPPIYPIAVKPAKLKPFILEQMGDGVNAPLNEVIDSELIRPLPKAITKMVSAPTRTFPTWLRQAFETHPEVIFDGFFPRTRKEFRFWTIEEALAKLDMSTSVGYDFQMLGFKSRTELWTKDGDVVTWVHPLLRKLVEELWNAMRAGKSLKNVVAACLKDELRDIDRVNQGKTRLFCVGSLSHLVITVMVLGDMVFYMKENRNQTDVAIGINPHGWDWVHLNRKMRRWADVQAKYGGGDFSNYDSSILSGFAYGLYCAMKMYSQWTDSMKLFILMSVIMSSVAPIMIIIREAYWMDWMNSSGGWLTGFLNSFVNVVIFNGYIIFINLTHNQNFVRAEVLIISVYGDDNVWAAHISIWAFFDMQKLSVFIFDMFGMTYTTPNKGEIVSPYLEYNELSFLCRSLSTDEYPSPKLEKSSIIGMLLWVRKPKRGVSVETQLGINIEQAAMEFYHHGKEIFDEETSRIRDYCSYFSIPYTGKSYDEYARRWDSALRT